MKILASSIIIALPSGVPELPGRPNVIACLTDFLHEVPNDSSMTNFEIFPARYVS